MYMKHELWRRRVGGWLIDLTVGTNLLFGCGFTHSKASSTIVWWQFFFGPFVVGCYRERIHDEL